MEGNLRYSSDSNEFVLKARELTPKLTALSSAVDKSGSFPKTAMGLLHENGFSRLSMPKMWGGVAPDDMVTDIPDMFEFFSAIAAGEPNTAHIWLVQDYVVRRLFGTDPVPKHILEHLRTEILDKHVSLASTAAERSSRTRFGLSMPARRVKGGLVINGTKHFGTGSNGATYSRFQVLLEGDQPQRHIVLVRLDAEGVRINNDWDNMGQRATGSGSVTYNDVFVPDDWHWAPAPVASDVGDLGGPYTQMQIAAVILGIGFAALEALRDHTLTRTKPFDQSWKTAAEDPIIQHAVGRYAVKLHAARALGREACLDIVRAYRGEKTRADASVSMMRGKLATIDATMTITQDIHRYCGGQSTTNEINFDRFWRNARTLANHDWQDIKLKQVGMYELTGAEPPSNSVT
jgi:alkylation response protein AidB-like acyl-CoA dehydrogenase